MSDESLFSGFLRGDPDRRDPSPPRAAFAPTDAIAQTPALQFRVPNDAGKMFLGVMGARIQSQRLADGRLDRYAMGGTPIGVGDDRHMVTIAGSRSGKGRSSIVPNLLMWPGSAVVIDPKGDLARYTAKHRATSLDQTVHVLDPFHVAGDLAEQYPGHFNPLKILHSRSKTAVEDAGLIADALVIESEREPHWDQSAKMFIETLILHAATAEAFEGRRDLITVHELIARALQPSEGEDMYWLEAQLESNNAEFGAIQNGGRAFYDRSDRELQSVLSTVRRHTHFLSYRQIKPVLREVPASIDLRSLKREPTTLYLILPATRMGTCNRWLRMFINLTLAAMEIEQARPRHALLMCLDEFAVLGPMKTIEDAAGQIAGLGVKLWPILQDLGQLKALYKDRWETFLGNAGVIQFFGNADLTTLNWISERLGQTIVVNESQNAVDYDARVRSGATGSSWSQQAVALMTSEEISRFFGREDPLLRQLIIRPAFEPMVLQRAYYDRHRLFM